MSDRTVHERVLSPPIGAFHRTPTEKAHGLVVVHWLETVLTCVHYTNTNEGKMVIKAPIELLIENQNGIF